MSTSKPVWQDIALRYSLLVSPHRLCTREHRRGIYFKSGHLQKARISCAARARCHPELFIYISLFTIIMVARKNKKKQIYSKRLKKREHYTTNLTKKADVHKQCAWLGEVALQNMLSLALLRHTKGLMHVARKGHREQMPPNCSLALTNLFYKFLLTSFVTNVSQNVMGYKK